MKCPKCGKLGFIPNPKGRPLKLDDHRVSSLRKKGWSLAEIAKELKVTRGAIYFSIERLEGK